MGLEDLKSKVAEFCAERDWDQFHDIKELAIGVSTEAAELLELFRFKQIREIDADLKKNDFRGKVEDELADVLFFLLRISGRYEIDLERALASKMKKNAEKYPVEKAKGSNRKYDEF